jgi:hypothetical protein
MDTRADDVRAARAVNVVNIVHDVNDVNAWDVLTNVG